MAEPITINVSQAATPVPASYTVPGSAEVEPLSAFARFNGSAASGPFLPCLAFYSPGGLLLGRFYPDAPAAVGDTVDVTYAPGLSSSVSTSQAATPSKLISAATTNSTLVRAGPTELASYFISNQNAAVRYVKLYDKATAPTVGTDVPKWTLGIPGGASANISLAEPLQFTLGLGLGITVLPADNDTTAVAASEIVVNLGIF